MVSDDPLKPQDDPLDERLIEQRRDAALLRALSTPHKKQSEMKLSVSPSEVATHAIQGAMSLADKWLRDDFGPSLLLGKLGKRICVVRNIFRKTKRFELLRFDVNDDDFAAADRAPLLANIRKSLEPLLVSRRDLILEDLPEGFVISAVNIGKGE
jgi:hypothetical protein